MVSRIRRRRVRGLLTGAALTVAVLSTGAAGQLNLQARTAPVLSGRVLSHEGPVGNIPVTLHRITPDSSGPVASAVSAGDGTFRFALERDPSAAFNVFIATADYLSVRYFGTPVHGDSVSSDYVVVVYDTASVLPQPIRIASRNMILISLGDGSWEVNEVIRLLNPTRRALVGQSGTSSWQFRIPAGALDFEAGEGDVRPHELSRIEDRVMLLTPVAPGSRELVVRYRLPPRPNRSALPITEETDTFNLFVQQPSHLTGVAGLRPTRLIEAEGAQYLQYSAAGIAPGTTLEFEWSGAFASPVDPLLAAILVTLLLLGIGAWAAVRNRGTLPTA